LELGKTYCSAEKHGTGLSGTSREFLEFALSQAVSSGVVAEHALTTDNAEVVVALVALLHDVGMAIHRDDHERFSLILAAPKLRELLKVLST